jgi:hypothetical protein
MMFQATTPDGIVYWVEDMPGNFFGSALVIYKLKAAIAGGFEGFYNAEPIDIDLNNGADVRLALELLYPDAATFSENAPTATAAYEPFDADVVY